MREGKAMSEDTRQMLDAALDYARQRWPVLPLYGIVGGKCTCGRGDCNSPGKHPRTRNGLDDATVDVDLISTWWDRWPAANVGVVAAGAGIVVVDIDPRHDGDATWSALKLKHGFSTDTLISLTGGGGWHVIYRAPGLAVKSGSLGPGVDVKAGRGYIVLPPSAHISGKRYQWEQTISGPLAALPAELLALMTQNQTDQGGERARGESERIGEGERNMRLISLGGRMRANGADAGMILTALLQANASLCDPPLGLQEVRQIAASAAKYEAGEIPIHNTDLGNALRFTARYTGHVKYAFKWGWRFWSGKRWVADDVGELWRLAQTVVVDMYHEAAALGDDDARARLAKHALSSESASRLTATLALAEHQLGIACRPTDFDPDHYLLNLVNGTFDTRTDTLRPHDPDDLITKLCPVEYDSEAECPMWLEFLDTVLAGDQDLIDFVQRVIGYSLTGDTSEQVFFMLYGRGANGKSTFLETIGALLGDYGKKTPSSLWTVGRGDAIRNDVAALVGVRFAMASETEDGQRLAEALIKELTGGDTVTVRFLHREFFEFIPQAKLFLATNHKPEVRGTDHALWRRLKLIPFTVTIAAEDQDHYLGDKLRTELPGILNWALDGLKQWRDNGLGKATGVLDATRAYRTEQDPIAGFVDERCVTGRGLHCAFKELYISYCEWAEDEGKTPISKTKLGRSLRERGFERLVDGRKTVYLGLGLATYDDEPEQAEIQF